MNVLGGCPDVVRDAAQLAHGGERHLPAQYRPEVRRPVLIIVLGTRWRSVPFPLRRLLPLRIRIRLRLRRALLEQRQTLLLIKTRTPRSAYGETPHVAHRTHHAPPDPGGQTDRVAEGVADVCGGPEDLPDVVDGGGGGVD